LIVRIPIQLRIWRRSIPIAWERTRIIQPTRIAIGVAIAALNILWRGHGILRSSPFVTRFVVVLVGSYLVTTIAEFLWLLSTGPRFTGFESPTTDKGASQRDSVEPLATELSVLPPAELRDETLEFAKAMKNFEAGSDREFVNSLAGTQAVATATESEHDEVLDKQSAELFEHNLRTWRAYRERFYRPARAFRDELRKRLGIRNMNSEPRIPALDQAELTGAKPIAQAADYLAGLARRLK
jgi:hypothetical protein